LMVWCSLVQYFVDQTRCNWLGGGKQEGTIGMGVSTSLHAPSQAASQTEPLASHGSSVFLIVPPP
jgi:hypothetical protein